MYGNFFLLETLDIRLGSSYTSCPQTILLKWCILYTIYISIYTLGFHLLLWSYKFVFVVSKTSAKTLIGT